MSERVCGNHRCHGNPEGDCRKNHRQRSGLYPAGKRNQETLLEDISLYFKDEVFNRPKKELEKEGRYWKEKDFDHGRIEIREYYVENEVEWLRENHPGWKGLSGMGACVATVTENGKTTTALSYSIYSQEEMKAEEYGKGKRAHWRIENSLHWVLDIGFREDESRIRAGNAAENVNVLRHIGTNLLKQEKSCRMGIASKRKKCGYDQKYLYKVLSGLNTGMK